MLLFWGGILGIFGAFVRALEREDSQDRIERLLPPDPGYTVTTYDPKPPDDAGDQNLK
jgi:hypothetical protein